MGNRPTNYAPPFFMEPYPIDDYTYTTIRPRRQYIQEPLPPKIRAIFIPQAPPPPVGICAIPMAVAAPVAPPYGNPDNKITIDF
ncbi:unnamed protein product [Rotaria sp. Silwood1]|nr:unnamed protein product [Rotaria sp. Silwood1]